MQSLKDCVATSKLTSDTSIFAHIGERLEPQKTTQKVQAHL